MKLTETAKAYARLTRFQTVPLEMVPATVGAVVATGGPFNTQVLSWAVFGMLYHLVGYGQNSLEDWKRGWDTDDPNKQHHPLNAGRIPQRTAELFVYGLFAVLILYTTVIASNWVALVLLLTGPVLCGTLYNTVGKRTRWKFLFIAYSHTTVFALPYYSITGAVDPLLLLGSLYVFASIVFQIAVSGEIKDITQDEANFLRELGARVEPGRDGHRIEFSWAGQLFAYGIRSVTVALGIAFGYVVGQQFGRAGPTLFGSGVTESQGESPRLQSWVNVKEVTLAGIGALSVILTWSMLQSGPSDRTERIATMMQVEICSALMLLVAVVPIIGVSTVAVLSVASGTWVMVFNKLEWGRLIAPAV